MERNLLRGGEGSRRRKHKGTNRKPKKTSLGQSKKRRIIDDSSEDEKHVLKRRRRNIVVEEDEDEDDNEMTMMNKLPNVLVLCQRKKGSCYKNINVQDLLVPKIKRYISQTFYEDYNIEFLSFLGEDKQENDEVDYNLLIDPSSEEFQIFYRKHYKFYNIILLNTCPTYLMNFFLISNMLKDDGILILSKVQCLEVFNKKDFEIPPEELFRRIQTTGSLLDYFVYDYNNHIYLKKTKNEVNSFATGGNRRSIYLYKGLNRKPKKKKENNQGKLLKNFKPFWKF
jgi:hypothetical protein